MHRHWFTLVLCAFTTLAQQYPTPTFTDASRTERLKRALPEVRRVFEDWAKKRGVPGLSFGIVIDGEPMLLDAIGMAKRDGTRATPDTQFRIASMTKSFTALAVLKLRDEGKLSLEDEASKWIPELAKFKYPTADSPVLRVRHLLTHSAGFPEDNPWGDQQLGVPFGDLTAWLEKGIPWSTTPGTNYEYSNYGFALAGRVIEKASGRAYREYVETEILKPLGMSRSTLEPADTSNAAVGYRFQSGRWSEEPSLRHGAFGAMGGLVTTGNDLAKYVAFHLDAWPPRDGVETGPVRRASVREMQQMWRFSTLSVRRDPADNTLDATAAGYGYGLRISTDCRFGHMVAHGGGLPGFGSYMLWLPEYGVGAFAMSNLTYAGPIQPLQQAMDVLRRTGALRPREWPASPALENARQTLFRLFTQWNEKDATGIAANNLFMDASETLRQQDISTAKRLAGNSCKLDGPLRPLNWLRGEFDIACDRGSVHMFFTMAPTMPPTVQQWFIEPAPRLDAKFTAAANQIAAGKAKVTGPLLKRLDALKQNYGACKLSRTLTGDGVSEATVLLNCDRGDAQLTLSLDSRGQLGDFTIAKPSGTACVP